jgi:hypothetical protein
LIFSTAIVSGPICAFMLESVYFVNMGQDV